MFTGLIEEIGEVLDCRPVAQAAHLQIRASAVASDAAIGDSIAINGCCLTLVERIADRLRFEAGEETLRLTNLSGCRVGSQVNLERSLRASDRLGGHYVSGHIDGLGTIRQRVDSGSWSEFVIQPPVGLLQQIVRKGSIAVDGVSLTIADLDTRTFRVALIPHTLQVTTLGQRQVGDRVNLETDILAKYVARQLEFQASSSSEI